MKKLFLISLILFTACYAGNDTDVLAISQRYRHLLPDEYRLPTHRDITGTWYEQYRSNTREPYFVRSDFNGDRLLDYAFILFPKSGIGFQVAVLLSNENTYRFYPVYTNIRFPAQLYQMQADDSGLKLTLTRHTGETITYHYDDRFDEFLPEPEEDVLP